MELWRWMSLMYAKETFDREDIHYYFHLLSKEIKKEFGRRIRLELIIVGGMLQDCWLQKSCKAMRKRVRICIKRSII